MEQREEAGVQLYGFQQQLSAVQGWLAASKEQVRAASRRAATDAGVVCCR